ncbi:MAG TPA: hypothetical protein VFO79_05655, partial [Xanthomonadales bacterium]|nr:hypothetical protein [Xanthomonadales bacterium]
MNARSGTEFDNDGDRAGLDAHVDALRAAEPSAAQADAAQQRLMARVASARPAPRERRTWLWAPAGAFAA